MPDNAAADIARDESATMFTSKGKTLEETTAKATGRTIVDDGGDTALLIHEGKKAEGAFSKDDTLPDPSSTDNEEFKIFLTIIKRLLESGETDEWNKIARRCKGVSKETTTGVHRLYTITVTKSKFDNFYGCAAAMRANGCVVYVIEVDTTGKVYMLPKTLDEKVAGLHLKRLGAKLTTLASKSEYVGIPVEGPYKPDKYRY
ncbi:hypothetical protein ACHAWF_018033 [Thalassiosira exigua]